MRLLRVIDMDLQYLANGIYHLMKNVLFLSTHILNTLTTYAVSMSETWMIYIASRMNSER